MIKSTDGPWCYEACVPSLQMQSMAGSKHIMIDTVYEALRRFWIDARDRPQHACMELCLTRLSSDQDGGGDDESKDIGHDRASVEL